MNEALNEAVHERFRFIEGIYWLQFIRFFRGPFNIQMLHIPALNLGDNLQDFGEFEELEVVLNELTALRELPLAYYLTVTR